MEKQEDEKIRCEKCGRFVKTTPCLSEGGSEMITGKCSCGQVINEGY